MTPNCGRIDVKYVNCLYHTRIGLGKWTHDPTLKNSEILCDHSLKIIPLTLELLNTLDLVWHLKSLSLIVT